MLDYVYISAPARDVCVADYAVPLSPVYRLEGRESECCSTFLKREFTVKSQLGNRTKRLKFIICFMEGLGSRGGRGDLLPSYTPLALADGCLIPYHTV